MHWGGGGGDSEAPLDKFCHARKTAALSAAPLHYFLSRLRSKCETIGVPISGDGGGVNISG